MKSDASSAIIPREYVKSIQCWTAKPSATAKASEKICIIAALAKANKMKFTIVGFEFALRSSTRTKSQIGTVIRTEGKEKINKAIIRLRAGTSECGANKQK